MDFIDQLRTLAARISMTQDLIKTEEATKNATVMPFLQILGYNVFDPTEVTPELIADIGTKKGEKVDYAILRHGQPIMLLECKKLGAELCINHASQLFRYFHVTAARFGVLTNGSTYKFFTDLEQPNRMDEKPFFEFNILDFKEREVEELKKFAKSYFDIDTILTTASELKYTRAIQNKLSDLLANPSEDFVRLLSGEVIVGKRFTQPVIEQFSAITRRAFEQLLSERINDRLKGALVSEPEVSTQLEEAKSPLSEEGGIVTTAEEIEGFHIVRAIPRDIVSSRRIFMRDAQSYCAILLDDNNRKPICRLWFNNTERLALGIFNGNKEQEKINLAHLDDLYMYADRLKATVRLHLPSEGQNNLIS